MKKYYTVRLNETYTNVYVVEADSEEEAKEIINDDCELETDTILDRWCECEGESTPEDIAGYELYESDEYDEYDEEE